jgi:branched-chain amino acid transport system permease protein
MSGTLSAIYNGYVGPSALDWRLSAQLMLAVVVGGAHSIWGAFLSGAGLHVLKIYLTGFTERWPMVLGLIYVIVVVILPEGLTSFGSQVKRIKFVFLDRGCL